MHPIRRLARLLLFLICTTLARAADLPRVAVVTDSPEPSLAAFADLLSISLASASNQYALVERAEITKLAAEAEIQKLAADQRPAALAKLAKADGLIIIGADKGDPKQPKLTLRLTSTNNGLVLRSLILGGKENEFPEAAKLATGVLRFPCERLTQGDAKPPIIVSLLGIRPAFEIDRALETTLNLAIAQQLSAQSGIAVSERWRMNDLVFERSLSNAKQEAFATGTVLLDGSYTRKGDQLEFSLRLRKADREAGKTLTLQGPANKPTDLSQQIAKLIAIDSGQSGEAVAWDTLEEGKQYAELGWWLCMRSLWQEAIPAYESAVALGNELAVGERPAAYQYALDPNAGERIPRTMVDGWDNLSKEAFRHKVLLAIKLSDCALLMMEPHTRELMSQKHHNVHQRRAVSEFFLTDMKVLQALCLRGEQLDLASEARTLRVLSRKILARGKEVFRADFCDEMVQRAYMHDTPEDAVAELHVLLDPAKCTSIDSSGHLFRFCLWQNRMDRLLWRAVDWSSTNNKRADEVMQKLIEELQASPVLMNRVDGYALGFQEGRSTEERAGYLDNCCKLLETRFDEFTTEVGQLVFENIPSDMCFRAEPSLRKKFESRFAKINLRMFEAADWLDVGAIRVITNGIHFWSASSEDSSAPCPVPEVTAIQLLDSVERYTKRTQADPRWKQYRISGNADFGKRMLGEIPYNIVREFPNIRQMRLHVRPPVPGAVAIRAWKPDVTFGKHGPLEMRADHILSSGGFLFIVCRDQGILKVDVEGMAAQELIDLPIPNDESDLMAVAGGDLMVSQNRRLFIRHLQGDDRNWKPLETPGVTPKDPINWYIAGLGDEFLIGSVMIEDEKPSPRMLIGKVRDGRLTWVVSSNRYPQQNPIDAMDPCDVTMAYRNTAGKTMVFLDGFPNSALVELETGRLVSVLQDFGKTQPSGNMPLFWKAPLEASIDTLVAFDPAQEQPLLLFKPDHGMPERWKNDKSLHDRMRPEYQGNFIAPIVHEGNLWLLKREPDLPGRSEKNGPNDFRLVCVPLRGGEPKVIPLVYEVPESIRKAGVLNQDDLENPVINQLSLTATPKGLFFSPVGLGYGAGVHRFGGIPIGGAYSPALLYITWDDINAWLAKNALQSAKSVHEPTKSDSP